ncbi:sulfatase-like hydrolase/transferase [Candidatus Sumerlaeota bacterium]|nr:sulfatase-like hydrolase/transferase [Candidatus Sumerlaeota bacterium]
MGSPLLESVLGYAAEPGRSRRAQGRSAPDDKRPNIILAMTDDQGWADTGYNSANNPERDKVVTPAMDAMAAAGVRFNRFYAQCPLCSPTRGSVMTGRHPFRYGTFSPGSPFRNQEVAIAQALKTVGYATGHFGKWHLNGVSGPGQPVLGDDPLSPGRFGFDEWFSVSNFFDRDWTFSRKGEIAKVAGDGSDAIVAEALRFISAAAQSKTPFLAVIWYGSPHNPIDPTPEYQQKAGGSAYYGEIYGVDHSLGTLRQELRRLGIADNTLIWFTSDNGGVPEYSVGGLRGRKGTVWEGGLRVPGIIEWPARIRKPLATDVAGMSSDIYPTILELVGVKMPNQVLPLDGISLAPLLEGRMIERPRPIAFWHGGGGKKDSGHAALTGNQFKLHKLAPDKYELYDLLNDLAESRDIAAQHPDIVAQMKSSLLSWQDSVVNSLAGNDYPGGLSKEAVAAAAEFSATRYKVVKKEKAEKKSKKKGKEGKK